MVDVMILGLALVAGTPPVVVAALAAVLFAPPVLGIVGVGVMGVIAVRRRHDASTPVAERRFLQAVAAELRAGSTLRMATVDAAANVPELGLDGWARRAEAGRPIAELAALLRSRLPIAGRPAAAAVQLAATSGGAASSLFEGLAHQVDEAIALRRERRAASAQARLSAGVVAGAPLLVLAWLGARGSLGALMRDPAGGIVLGLGVLLEFAGIALTITMLRRAEA